MALDWSVSFFVVTILAVVLLGLSKGGFVGVGAISLPLMALVAPPIAAAAILLPILIVQDLVSVWAFRRDRDDHLLRVLLPGSVVGIFLGYLLAATVSTQVVLGCVGVLSVVFGAYRLWLDTGGRLATTRDLPEWVGSLFGLASGFTSQIAHAGGPPYQMWVMPRRLPRDTFVGTTAIFFAITNWVKMPAYLALGQFTATNLLTTLVLMPVAILSTFAGVALVRRVSAERFYVTIYILMILVGVKLIWDAF
ncbi:sulfite exporter TauE/SafE family protein [Aurantiacibacter zhengii]|uniref:Probable membrane transporter protein n=1 Tax=Aurantiacibacter zhengii TaxID=2307003 RepID=A0A418NT38_9SPHN|nr:sulfite exporter TauE/SafE family protein [Aurantiacibacter zhengii]RIV86805.1 sulfite exporter TauE/SafE family protein [Aurantiacibacter zhengii]